MNWSRAFARQACADFEARDWLLENPSLPPCQQMHFLQMAMEKTAKAHLIDAGSDPASLQSSHAYTAKVIPIIVKDGLGRGSDVKPAWLMKAIAALARRIELLHPSVDDAGAVPSNCEYPWENAAREVLVPADFDFRLDLSGKPAVTMIKETRIRAMQLSTRDVP